MKTRKRRMRKEGVSGDGYGWGRGDEIEEEMEEGE